MELDVLGIFVILGLESVNRWIYGYCWLVNLDELGGRYLLVIGIFFMFVYMFIVIFLYKGKGRLYK